MTVIPLHPKNKIDQRNATETLSYVLSSINAGDTDPESVVVVWNERSDDDIFRMRYIVGGETTLASTLGMLDIVKDELLK